MFRSEKQRRASFTSRRAQVPRSRKTRQINPIVAYMCNRRREMKKAQREDEKYKEEIGVRKCIIF